MTVAVFLNVVAGQACALMLMFWLAWAGVSWPVSTVVLPYATVSGLAASVSVDDAADHTDRVLAAARLGRERRRLFLIGTVLSLATPLLPYLTGAWETAWFVLATTPLALPLRARHFHGYGVAHLSHFHPFAGLSDAG